MEQDGMPPAGVTRGLNVAYVLPPDPTRAASFLTPALDRIDASGAGPQLLVVVADAESAMALAAVAQQIGGARGVSVFAATSETRAARLLRGAAPQVVVGTSHVLVELLRRSALKLAPVRYLVLAWVDDQADASLETLLAEAPKDAARAIVARELSPAVEELIERHARRARRVLPAIGEEAPPLPLQFVAGPEASKPAALRRTLDELDPESGFVFVRDPQSDLNTGTVLRTMGYAPDGALRAGRTLDADVEILVLYDLPATRTELRELLNGHAARRVIALVQARQIPAVRELAGGVATPFALPEVATRARTREAEVRNALRQELAAGVPSREVLALEPLLAEFDGIEIAAAALRLLEEERRRTVAAAPPAVRRMVRLFVNAGQTDGIRPGDLVGAIANLAGLAGSEVGRVEIRDRHALVEVPEPVAAMVVEKLTGTTIKGRQIVARLDQERGERSSRERPTRGGGTRSGRGPMGRPPRGREGGTR